MAKANRGFWKKLPSQDRERRRKVIREHEIQDVDQEFERRRKPTRRDRRRDIQGLQYGEVLARKVVGPTRMLIYIRKPLHVEVISGEVARPRRRDSAGVQKRRFARPRERPSIAEVQIAKEGRAILHSIMTERTLCESWEISREP